MPANEQEFRQWYRKAATEFGLSPDPDESGQLYDYRSAFQAGAWPDRTGHWPSQFKKSGHPNEVVGGFNTRTGARVPGTRQEPYERLIELGWEPDTARRLSYTAGGPVARTLSEPEFEAVKAKVYASLPDNLTEDEFNRVIGPRMESALAEAEYGRAPVGGSAIGRFAREAAQGFNPLPILSALASPIESGKQIVRSHVAQLEKAKQAAQEGRYSEAAGHGAAAAVPLLGPVAADIGERIGAGDVAGGLGAVAALGAPAVAVKGAQAVWKARPKGPIFPSRLNPEEALSVRLAQREGIPLDVATKTGSPYARALQKRVANSLGGEGSAERLLAAQEKGLTKTLQGIADRVLPAAATPETAGRTVSEGLRSTMGAFKKAADEAYGSLRALEADPLQQQRVPTAPAKSVTYERMMQSLRASEPELTSKELYGLRQVVAELESQPYTKRLLRPSGKGGSLEHVPGTGGAGAKVYDDINQAMARRMIETGENAPMSLTRGEMEASIKQALESGSWTPSARGALDVVRRRQGDTFYTGPSLPDETPLLGTTTEVGLPVEVGRFKHQIKPLYDRLKRESELRPMMGDEGKMLGILDRFLDGPEVASASVVDRAVSDLKRLARQSDVPELRSRGEALASVVARQLDAEVKAAVAKGGEAASQALESGRLSTKAKYEVGELYEALRAEPVKVFQQVTAPKDTGIAFARQIADAAPESIPHVGRAWIEQALTKATAEGGFQRAAGLMADWQALGPQTKALLFGPERTAKLNNFFLLAKRIAENPNPSGTAHTLTATNLIGSLATWPLAKLLYTPRGVDLLTNALRVARDPSASAIRKRQAVASVSALVAKQTASDGSLASSGLAARAEQGEQ